MSRQQGKRRTTSRDRLLSAIVGDPGAPTPCCFMIFSALLARCRDYQQMALSEQELGLDVRVPIVDLPVRFSPDVRITESLERPAVGPPLLHRSYQTSAGTLTATVRKTDDWPHGDRLPLFGDHIAPRATKFLVAGPADLAPLRALLAEPTADDIAAFRQDAAQRARFADDHGFLLAGGWGATRRPQVEDRGLIGSDYGTATVVDALMWLCGATQPLLWAYDDPRFLSGLISLLETYNRRRLELHLETGAKLIFHRGWYEGTEFWSPRLYRQFVFPSLQREAELCHQAGAYLAYILTSGMLPIADIIVEAGVDVVVGIDPGEGKGTTLEAVRSRLGGRVALWGGVSGPLIVERGSEQDVRGAVEQAMGHLAPTGRFVLSPVDNVTDGSEHTWRNVEAFVDSWRRIAG
ncbi:MAG: uroporphyrinogen decarboxylase family protein [Armatimonadota bacterium]